LRIYGDLLEKTAGRNNDLNSKIIGNLVHKPLSEEIMWR